MATPATALPKLDMSTSVPLDQASSAQPFALPKLDMSTSVPIGTDTSTVSAERTFASPPEPPAPSIPIQPPQDHKEELVRSIAGDFGLKTYRAARDTVVKVETLLKSPSTAYEAAKQDILDNIKATVTPEPYDIALAHHQLYSEPIMPMPGVGAAAKAFGAEEAAAPAVKAATTAPALRVNPFRQILKGKAVAQEPAQAAVRGAVGAGTETPILAGSKTVLDEPLANLATKEKAAYKAVDDAAGFDVKEAKLQLKNDQYNLKQLGNTEADQTARVKLQASITDSTKRIGDAEEKLSAAGIDPKAADALHTARMAGTDFKASLVRSTAPDGTIDVNKLLNQSKALRFSKRGDRLIQFMGKDAAENYMTQLEAAQKAGIAAVRTQQIVKWIGIKALQGAGLTLGVEAIKHLVE